MNTTTNVQNTVQDAQGNVQTEKAMVRSNLHQSSGAARSEIKAANRAILEFARKSPRFQLEAICVMADVAECGGDLSRIPASDLQLVQWYLNYGYFKEDGNDREKFSQHRMQRTQQLMRILPQFLSKDACTVATISLLNLYNDSQEIDKGLQHLPSRPNINVGTGVKAG